jgi:hypothetical protein
MRICASTSFFRDGTPTCTLVNWVRSSSCLHCGLRAPRPIKRAAPICPIARRLREAPRLRAAAARSSVGLAGWQGPPAGWQEPRAGWQEPLAGWGPVLEGACSRRAPAVFSALVAGARAGRQVPQFDPYPFLRRRSWLLVRRPVSASRKCVTPPAPKLAATMLRGSTPRARPRVETCTTASRASRNHRPVSSIVSRATIKDSQRTQARVTRKSSTPTFVTTTAVCFVEKAELPHSGFAPRMSARSDRMATLV